MATRRTTGRVERATRKSLRALQEKAPTDLYDGLAASAVVLAQTLDDGAGMATAAVARELRTTLDALRPREMRPDGELAALLDRIQGAGAPAPPVGNPAN